MAGEKGIYSIAGTLRIHPSLQARTQGLILQAFNKEPGYPNQRLFDRGIGRNRSGRDQRLGLQLADSPSCILVAAIRVEDFSCTPRLYDRYPLRTINLK